MYWRLLSFTLPYPTHLFSLFFFIFLFYLGDNRLDRAEMQQLLGKLHVHLNDDELDIVLFKVGSDDKGNIGFVDFHKALFKAEHSCIMTAVRII